MQGGKSLRGRPEGAGSERGVALPRRWAGSSEGQAASLQMSGQWGRELVWRPKLALPDELGKLLLIPHPIPFPTPHPFPIMSLWPPIYGLAHPP